MSRFRFRLQPVLDQRRREERALQREVAEIERRRRELEDRVRVCQGRLAEERRAVRDDLERAGARVDVSRLRRQASVSGAIVGRAQQAVVELAGVHKRLEDARARLLEAATARKAVERLEERQREAWRLQEKRREERELDELNVMRAERHRAVGKPA